MDAVVVDLKDFAERTPEQVVRVFFGIYDAERVRLGLLSAFISAAGDRVPGEEEKELAELFDHLGALVQAVEQLRAGENGAGRCVFCGAEPGAGV